MAAPRSARRRAVDVCGGEGARGTRAAVGLAGKPHPQRGVDAALPGSVVGVLPSARPDGSHRAPAPGGPFPLRLVSMTAPSGAAATKKPCLDAHGRPRSPDRDSRSAPAPHDRNDSSCLRPPALLSPEPGHKRQLFVGEKQTRNPADLTQAAATCKNGRLTTHQDERHMSVKTPRGASFRRQDIARNAHSAHNAHRTNPQVRRPLRQAPGSPRTPHGASSGRCAVGRSQGNVQVRRRNPCAPIGPVRHTCVTFMAVRGSGGIALRPDRPAKHVGRPPHDHMKSPAGSERTGRADNIRSIKGPACNHCAPANAREAPVGTMSCDSSRVHAPRTASCASGARWA